MPEPPFSAGAVRARLIDIPGAQAEPFAESLAAFLTQLAKWNRVYNLIGFRDPQQLLDRVLVECLWVSAWLAGTEIADVGTGAGLPGLPLAITQPQRRFTLIESRAKRVHFLQHVVGELGLSNVVIEHSRAQDLPDTLRFDTVLARAVAAPPELINIARFLTRTGSRVVLLTSAGTAAAYQQLSEDFALRQIVPLGSDGQFGVVVHLERTG